MSATNGLTARDVMATAKAAYLDNQEFLRYPNQHSSGEVQDASVALNALVNFAFALDRFERQPLPPIQQ